MNISVIGLAALVAATSTLSVTAALMLSDHHLKHQQSLLGQAAAEAEQMEQRLAALQHRLAQETEENGRLRNQVATLERDADKLRAVASFNHGHGENNPSPPPAADERRNAALASSTAPTPWEQLRAGDAIPRFPLDEAEDGDDRIATVREVLSLDAGQQTLYAELLSDYEGRVDAVYDRVAEQYDFASGANPFQFQEMLVEIEREKSELDAMLDAEFSRALTDEQTSRYLALPAEERGVGPNAGLDRLELQILDLPFILSGSSSMDQAF
jgi:hypothetical protein